ncbi:uncharacterized protein LY89DRAFT_738134 [Mollisia scopiformis]|uniref:Uncharacterized protein n=1 Tax=Mollisia scopiformis TaxID=149040 RepID=A0A194WWJ3_MOLSC|nr:uncharacterized protein LY89DRAFT_738134 [Mollisia scopiformis]KUJ12346.1 hypothetical protein LY89DRAFT_738134 [Mollisia scopiformis]
MSVVRSNTVSERTSITRFSFHNNYIEASCTIVKHEETVQVQLLPRQANHLAQLGAALHLSTMLWAFLVESLPHMFCVLVRHYWQIWFSELIHAFSLLLGWLILYRAACGKKLFSTRVRRTIRHDLKLRAFQLILTMWTSLYLTGFQAREMLRQVYYCGERGRNCKLPGQIWYTAGPDAEVWTTYLWKFIIIPITLNLFAGIRLLGDWHNSRDHMDSLTI